MRNISFKKIVFIFVFILIGQIIIFSIKDIDKEKFDFASKKVFQEFKTEFPYEVEKFQNQGKTDEKVITELAKRIYIEEVLRRLKDRKVRGYIWNLSANDKNILIEGIEIEIKQEKRSNPDSYKVLELEHELKIIEKGYNPITFIMEKVVGLDSTDSLKNQKKYFFILLTIILFLVISIYKISTKKHNEKD